MRSNVPAGEGPRKVEFDERAIARMYRLREQGESDLTIARRFGVDKSRVARLIGKRVAP